MKIGIWVVVAFDTSVRKLVSRSIIGDAYVILRLAVCVQYRRVTDKESDRDRRTNT